MYICPFIFTDIDECASGGDNCHSNANCTNTDGSFSCTCRSGYSGNGVDCEGMYVCTYMYMHKHVRNMYMHMYVRKCIPSAQVCALQGAMHLDIISLTHAATF